MIAIILIMLLIYVIFMLIFKFKSKDEKVDMMCIEKCNREDCDYCIDREQCTRRKTEV
jgi:ascorbate-specific PTS system EIIC-type component UlaA